MNGHVFLGSVFFVCFSVFISSKTVGFSHSPSGEAYSSTERVFERGIERELQRILVGSDKLLGHAERDWIRFVCFTALTGPGAVGFSSRISGKVRSSTECTFGCGNCGIEQEIQQILILFFGSGTLLSHAERVHICIASYPDICILSRCKHHCFCLISPVVSAEFTYKEIDVCWGTKAQWLNTWLHKCVKKDKKTNLKRSKARIQYYSNSVATFQLLIISGDIQINPGPSTTIHSHCSCTRRAPLSTQCTQSAHKNRSIIDLSRTRRCPGNLINVTCSPNLFNGCHKNSMLLCIFNARSVRNKTADLRDYVCDCKADLYAITETWLNIDDAAVRAELCPDGFKFIDHPRISRRGGGTGLLYRDSLQVKVVEAGEKD